MNISLGECTLCKSKNIEKLSVNTHVSLIAPETEKFGGRISQKIYQPSHAYLCHDCGHIDFFCEHDSSK